MPGVSELWTCYARDYSILPGAEQARHVRRDIQVTLLWVVSRVWHWDRGRGHVLCRALRNTCSLADSAQHYSNSTKHSLADALINDACSPCLTLWCFHVTAWGRGMFQVKKTMTMLPNRIPYVPGDIWHCTPTLDLGRPASQNVTSADSLNTRFWYLWHCNTSEQRTRDGQYLARKCCGPWNSHSFGGEENTITRQWQHMATLGTVQCHQELVVTLFFT